MIPRKDAPAKPASMVDAFEAAQGFMVLADLGRLENEQDRLDALAAIRSSIKNHRPEKGMKSYGWSPVLNDAAAKPYFDLLKSKSSALRRWAIQRGVNYVQITPYIATNLIGLLSDHDRTLARSAARHLMQHRYLPASKKLREFAAKDDELGHKIRCYLQGRKIEDALDNLNQEAQTRILPHVPDRAKSPAASTSIDFSVSKTGELRHNETSRADVLAASAVQVELEKVDWKKMEVRPFRFDVFVWRDAAGLQCRVREWGLAA